MKRTLIIVLKPSVGGFTDDKDEAKRLRTDTLLPALESNNRVVIDFKNVKASTQSYVHALLGEALFRFKEPVLSKLEFRNCSPQLKSLIGLVVDYSLGGFTAPNIERSDEPKRAAPKRRNAEKVTA